MKIKNVVHQAEEGGYWAEVPAIPGCASQGETFEELLQNLCDAVEGCAVESEVEDCVVSLSPARPAFTLSALLAGVSPSNIPDAEIDALHGSELL